MTGKVAQSTAGADVWNRSYATGKTPWSCQTPCRELVRLFRQYCKRPARVLELGCGNGVNSCFLASEGYEVVAIDFSEVALTKARATANAYRGSLNFLLGDVTDLPASIGEFDVVVERGCYHSLSLSERLAFKETVAKVTRAGSMLLSLVGNDSDGESWGPPRLSAGSVLAAFQDHFNLLELRRGRFDDPARDEGPLCWTSAWSRRGTRPTSAPLSSLIESTLAMHDDISVCDMPFAARLERVIRLVRLAPSCPWSFDIRTRVEANEADLLISFLAPDRDTVQERVVNYVKSKAFLSTMSDAMIIQALVTNLVVVATHEILESTLVCGQRVFDPHAAARFLDTRYADALTV